MALLVDAEGHAWSSFSNPFKLGITLTMWITQKDILIEQGIGQGQILEEAIVWESEKRSCKKEWGKKEDQERWFSWQMKEFFIRINWATWSNPTKWSERKSWNTPHLGKNQNWNVGDSDQADCAELRSSGETDLGQRQLNARWQRWQGLKGPAAWGIPCRAQHLSRRGLERASGPLSEPLEPSLGGLCKDLFFI